MSGDAQQPVMFRRWVRVIFRSGAVFLWVLALLLFLEVGARLVQKRWESRNQLVAFKEALPYDAAAVAPFLKLREDASRIPAADSVDCGLLSLDAAGVRLTDAARESARRNASNFSLRPVSGELRREVLEKFPGLTEEERNAYALLHGELACSLDAEGRLINSYGDYWARLPVEQLFTTWLGALYRSTVLRGDFQKLRAACRDAEAGKTGLVEVPAPQNSSWLVLMAGGKGRGRELAYIFLKAGDGELRQSTEEPLPPDSPWEQPWFRYKRNLRNARGAMGSLISTNNHGYYDTDFDVPKPAGTFRILCIGGSTTEEGATVETTYPNRLERMLADGAPGMRVEVFNCGIAGISPEGHIEKLDEYLSFEPDLVIVYEGVNDLLEFLPAYWSLEPDAWWRNPLRRSCLMRMAFPTGLLPPEAALRRDVKRVVVERLDALGRVFMSKGIPIAVCTIPFPSPQALSATERGYYDFDARSHWKHPWLSYAAYVRVATLLNEELRAWCARDGLCLIPLDAVYKDGYGVFTDLCHMDAAGVERKARAVMQSLAAKAQPRP
jgi:lysophospholipase L1-like esterase